MHHPSTPPALPDSERSTAFRRLYHLDAVADDAISRLIASAAEMLGAESALVSLANAGEAPCASHFTGSREHVEPVAREVSADVARAGGAVSGKAGPAAYAGAPLRGRGGAVAGAFCVVVPAPRTWSARELRFVEAAAAAVSAEIALCREREDRRIAQATAEQLRTTLDHIPSAAWLKDRAGRYVVVNRVAASLRGARALQAGKTDHELFPPEVAARFVEADRRAMETGSFLVGEHEMAGPDGAITWEVEKMACRDASGEVVGTVGIAHDVTERKRVERALRESEENFRQIAENIREIFWLFDAGFTRAVYVSPAFEEVWGRPLQTVYDDPQAFLAAVHPADVTAVQAEMERVSQGTPGRVEYRVLRPDGSMRWLVSRGFPVYDPDGRVYRLVGTSEDITARRQAEDERRVAEARYRRLVENAPDVVYELDRWGRFTELNHAAATVLGRDPAELIGRPFTEVVDPADHARGAESLRRKLDGDAQTTDLELRLVHASGERRLAHVRAAPVVENGEIVGTHGIARDITDERARARTMRLLEAAVASFSEGVSLTDQTFRLIYANAAYCRILGIGPHDWATLDVTTLAPDEHRPDQAGIRRALLEKGAWSGRVWRRRVSDGKVIPLDMIAGSVQAPSGERNLFFILREAADTIDREVRLRRAERLASVGTLIGGVAHELNNPLHAIRNFADLMLMDERSPDDLEALEVMRREADRAAKVVADLRLIARDTQEKGAERTAVDLNDVVRHVAKLRRYSLETSNVQLREELADGLPPVLANRGELEQVVLNLAVNAEQAMQGHRGECRLELRTRRTAGGASVHVVDTGRGISPEHLERIFDPFFTTKPPGEGTGLGLSLVHSIVAEHGGEIHVDSEPGRGTAFRVDLPLADVVPAQAPQPVGPGAPASRRRVLVVDDEDAIRRVTVRLLERLGHQADAAAEGAEALRMLDQADYDVILSDLKMPGLGGEELLQLLRERGGGLERRLVFVTGDAASGQAARLGSEADLRVLVKPVRMEDLARVVEQVAQDRAP
jgi:PAS domain S-box-containing protein